MAISGGRVTEGSIHTRVLANLQRNIAKGEKIQEQLSSGKQINRPSDSPTGTVSSLQLRGEARASQQYARNADDGIGWLGTMDDTLMSVSSRTIAARDLVVRGLNQGALDPTASDAIATEIEQIRAQLISYGNTKYMDRPVFGGSTTGEVAYDPSGAYAGDGGSTSRTVGAGSKVRIDTTGPEAFGSGDTQLFKVLQDVADSIRAGDATTTAENLKKLDAAHNLVKTTLSDVGARYNRLEQMKQSAQDRLLTVTTQLSDIEDVDLPKTIMEMQLQQTSYQAALAASAKVIQPSLIDFLR
ncbi:flagellar hook-associated protein FlgL [Actinoplanes sp. NBRC 103695]|uniref:flagellar hook-associated protein FlgL n=1 Tax=Actinoplanes sp. NBRC 103695 TaxID=3032202 RepID=UPI0024A47619|nr:flagellar hook-associated protein FlgL [Actinoplanes sp. NBRC 103695]GLY96855.1 flagellar hook-associated protein FlgL [Actinoplanes sp. NBRC 103695]